jgi:hypothetical protein
MKFRSEGHKLLYFNVVLGAALAMLLLAAVIPSAQAAPPQSHPDARMIMASSWRRSPDGTGYEPRSRPLARSSGLAALAGFALYRVIRSRRS